MRFDPIDLQSAYEIDPGYTEGQNYLTYVLLGVSTIGLLLTLVLLLLTDELRSSPPVKINICFSTALLLASLTFLLQDALINSQNTGLIKLVGFVLNFKLIYYSSYLSLIYQIYFAKIDFSNVIPIIYLLRFFADFNKIIDIIPWSAVSEVSDP